MKSLESLLTNLANLFKVKTLITLLILTAATVGFLRGMVAVELYMTMATMIVTFYFTKKESGE
jgi:hypothetical protein